MGVIVTTDANEAVASVAYRLNEVIAIYPITPASPMGEWADEWATRKQPNVFGSVPTVSEMQSEGGAIAAVHGSLQAGALSTTFTASQGLLLMIPNLYKMAGELTPLVIHVAARSVASHALSIFCDHSDVMACRQTGMAMLAASSVQEAQDFACIAQLASLRSRVPTLHFFDGFRTSHELTKYERLEDGDLLSLVQPEFIAQHRRRALSSERPVIRGTAQNPDAFFQAREAANPFYESAIDIFKCELKRFFARTGRRYQPFRYSGDPNAKSVLVIMGSGAQTASETAQFLSARGRSVGVVQVCLYRPFSSGDFFAALPPSVERIGVLDRTKECGSVGEPLYLDVVAAIHEGLPEGRSVPRISGGRFGLSSKEFTPSMVLSVFDMLEANAPRRHFTVGINDDVSGLSLEVKDRLDILDDSVYQAVFFGLGSDGTVGANKNSIKILGSEKGAYAQGYFVYDSKKAGALTVSHLRFGSQPINAPYLVEQADCVACHQFDFVHKMDVLERAKPGATFLLNSPYGPDEVLQHLPHELCQSLQEKRFKFFVIDGYRVARDAGLDRRINTVMQTAFFAISGLLDEDRAIEKIRHSIEATYETKGREVVKRNLTAMDSALAHLYEVKVPTEPLKTPALGANVPPAAPDFVQRVTSMLLRGKGDLLPVSAFPVDGTWPVGTSQWEKRNIAAEIPVWDPNICIQCNKCALVCPHATVRAKVYDSAFLAEAPEGFKSTSFKAEPFKGEAYTIQVAPEDCTGCGLCVEVCPAKDKSNPRHKALDMAPQRALREAESERYAFFLSLPEADRKKVHLDVKGSQLLRPLFEYSGACAGCGETPYIKLVTQLFGDRLLIANATGCSSIYGGNLPTTPYTTDENGRGPAWSNSLFEDNAEFGFGFRLAADAQRANAERLLCELGSELGGVLVEEILKAPQNTLTGIEEQRARIDMLRERLSRIDSPQAAELGGTAEHLLKKSIWLIGGDGWAYDIGYGGLDHVLASDKDINVLVLDTEVYSNTGGQQSKATPLGAAAKFATAGKAVPKKDLGLLAMSYGHVYVASVAFGAKDAQTVRALMEADAHPGPALVIAYSHCIAHGYDLRYGANQQKLAVEAGAWPLYRFDPRRMDQGLPPLVLDSPHPRRRMREYMQNETRFRMAEKLDRKRFSRLQEAAEQHAQRRTSMYEQLSHLTLSPAAETPGKGSSPTSASSAAGRSNGKPTSSTTRKV